MNELQCWKTLYGNLHEVNEIYFDEAYHPRFGRVNRIEALPY